MRRILVDRERLHAAEKRGRHPIHFSIDDVQVPVEERAPSGNLNRWPVEAAPN